MHTRLEPKLLTTLREGYSRKQFSSDLIAGVLLIIMRLARMGAFLKFITENLRERDESEARDISGLKIPKGVEVFEIYGSLFFAAIERFRDATKRIEKKPRVLILRMRNVLSIDATGLLALEDLLQSAQKDGMALVISAISDQPLAVLKRAGFIERLGEENMTKDIFEALEKADNCLDASD